jgi:hypothetical protein
MGWRKAHCQHDSGPQVRVHISKWIVQTFHQVHKQRRHHDFKPGFSLKTRLNFNEILLK